MRKIFLLFGLSLFLMQTSCSKENCVEDLIGSYVGTESCQDPESSIRFDLSQSEDEYDIIARYGNFETHNPWSVVAFAGNLSSNCKEITIPTQSSNTTSGLQTISGSFTLKKNKLEGTITFSGGSVCTYNLEKQ